MFMHGSCCLCDSLFDERNTNQMANARLVSYVSEKFDSAKNRFLNFQFSFSAMQCDPHCSNYDACVPSCPVETCDNILDQGKDQRMCNEDTCVEGNCVL